MSTPEPSFSSFEEFFAPICVSPAINRLTRLAGPPLGASTVVPGCEVSQVHRPVHVGAALVLKEDGGAVALVPVPWPLGDSARK